jgi:enoyl-CoA hydratase/carnithine racemase
VTAESPLRRALPLSGARDETRRKPYVEPRRPLPSGGERAILGAVPPDAGHLRVDISDRVAVLTLNRPENVNRVCSHDTLLEQVRRIAQRIASGPLVSFRYMKENIELAMTSDYRTLLDREALTHLRCGQTEDHGEGVAAFLEKREPRFRGR